VNIVAALNDLLVRFNLINRLGNFITDNASKNQATLSELATKYSLITEQRYVLCIGHVINLVAQQVLFGNDVDAFEPKLIVTVE
jgi:hypothetical protein